MNPEFCGRGADGGSFPGCCAIVLFALFLAGVSVLIYTATAEGGFDEEPVMAVAPGVELGAVSTGKNLERGGE